MNKLYRTFLFAGVLAFGLSACGDDVQVVDPADPPPPALSVSFAPSSVNVAVDQTVSLGLNIAGGAQGATATWTCSSDDASVASVSESGSGCAVTGLAQGSTAISANVTKGQQTATASASVNVAEIERAEVSIAQMPTTMTGEVDIVVNMDPRDETPTRLELLFIDEDGNRIVVDGQTFAPDAFPAVMPGEDAPAAQVQTIIFAVNTARLDRDPDTQLLTPRILNGDYTVRARLFTVQSGEAAPSATNDRQATVSNPDRVIVEHRSEMSDANTALVVDAGTGYRYWGGGDIVFQAHPILYSGAQPATVTISATSVDPDVTIADDTQETPFYFTADYEDNFGLVEDIIPNGGHTISVANVSDPDGIDVTPATFENLTDFYIDMTAPTIPAASIHVVNDAPFDAPPMGEYFSNGDFALSAAVTDAGSGLADVHMTFAAWLEGDEYADGVTEIGDLEEAGLEKWTLTLSSVFDRVGNFADDDDLETVDETEGFNVDMTGPDITGILPESDASFVWSGRGMVFSAADPDLADGEPGSGVDVATVTVEGIGATAEGGDDYSFDVRNDAGLDDGDAEITIEAGDLALESNVSEAILEFILDTTPPDLALDLTPNNTSTDAASVLRRISGVLSDENGVAEDLSSISIYHGTCAAYLGNPGAAVLVDEGTDPGEVDRNEIAIGGDFDEAFRFYNPDAGAETRDYCFVVEAGDVAMDAAGDPDPNIAQVRTGLTINWNPAEAPVATSIAVVGSDEVTVDEGASATLTVIVEDQFGNPMENVTVSFTSDDATTASVDPASDDTAANGEASTEVTGETAGSTTVTADAGAAGSVTFTITVN